MISFPGCKINIGLQVIEKRSDGFHNLESIFYPVPFHDILEINKKKSDSQLFNQTGLSIACDQENNLVVKAYRLMQKEFLLTDISIHLHKIIPSGSGLGGGSSDAAAIIKLINKYHLLNLTDAQMMLLAAGIGSDCAFFIQNKPSLITGRGDIISPSSLSLKGKYCAIIKPDIHISTAEAYKLVKPRAPSKSLMTLIKSDIKEWKEIIINDFEIPLFEKYPELKEIKQTLYKKGAQYASMTGSGSAVYGIFEKQIDVAFKNCFCWRGML